MSDSLGKVLVTGGAGFIGSNLVERLLTDGSTSASSTTSRPATARTSPASPARSTSSRATSKATSASSNAVKGCDVVFHQAALPSVPRSIQDPLTSNASNVIGTLNVLLAARDAGVRRVVFASSSSVYGANRDLPKREDMATQPDLALRRGKARRRELLPHLPRGLRPRDGRASATSTSSARARTRTPSTRRSSRSSSPPSSKGSARSSTATASSRATSPTSTTRSTRTSSPRPPRAPRARS